MTKNSKVLIVDDDENLLRAYSRIIRSEGYEVLEATTGEECLEIGRREIPDLILLDTLLPGMNGIEVCERVKADPALAHTFVIMISGVDTATDDYTQAVESGADGFLTKPIAPQVLKANVLAFLRIRRGEEELRESEQRFRLQAEELKQANRRLEEYNRLKAEFVANMSHELRTPLTAIIGFAQLAQMVTDGQNLPPRCSDAFERILRNGKHLLALIDDVLDISKIEAGRLKIHREHVDLVEVVQSAFAELQSLAQRKGIGYRLNVIDRMPLAFTDPLRIRQIVINLLSNAIKFTSKGMVEAELSIAGEDKFRLVVRDTGIGIDDQALHVIFERFRQVDGSISRTVGGAGLGLSIVRQIVELLGGEIDVDSKLNEGATFTVTLPMTSPEPAAKAAPLVQAVEEAVSENGRESVAARSQNGSKPLVLIVEDDADAAALLSETIQRAGYSIRIASSGPAGLQVARDLDPVAITLDVMMPDMDGWRVLQALKSDRKLARIPVIVCSIVDNRPLGYSLGASDYLLKPIEPERLLDILSGISVKGSDDDAYVLVVDDEHGVRELLTAALKHAGFNARSATSGETALKVAAASPPSAVLCDLMMPNGMSGFEFVARFRSDPQMTRIPIIIITGKDITPEDRKLITGQIANVIRKGELLMSDIGSRLRETLEELGVKPINVENTAD